MEKLIIAEKPSVATRLALALGGPTPQRRIINGVSYYIVNSGSDTLYIVAAAGHLFSLRQKEHTDHLPVFSVEWAPSYKVSSTSYFTKKYLDVIEDMGKRCSFFINACDYDIEGTVIGSNILKAVISHDVNAELNPGNVRRMKFSTTTLKDLNIAYGTLMPFDKENLDAGEARHILDWIWGINLSRALMHAIAASGTKKVLSVGRVQGPTLAILARRELEIGSFVSKPFWKLFVLSSGVEFENRRGNIEDEEIAKASLESTKNGSAVVKKHARREEAQYPYPPFDLTSLQLESSRVFGMDPSKTLAVAQKLYEHAYISYPRTSSQKLPYSLNVKGIINDLAKNQKYSALATRLSEALRFRPREGAKSDEAHPAIHPTGELPKGLEHDEERVYDLIAKRFLACFAEEAIVERSEILLDIAGEEYIAKGSILKKPGWFEFYAPYYKQKENSLPDLKEGERPNIEKAYMKKGMTEPPKRYSKATLISTLEKKNLGTKATRAAIIDTLFKRGYIKGGKLEVTEFGMSVYNTLNKYSSTILDEKLTSRLETDMERISKREISKEAVISEGKSVISEAVKRFSEHSGEIGKELSERLRQTEKTNALGKCRCGGDLVIKVSRNRKSFVGCTNWPECTQTYPLPQFARVVPKGKVCEFCHTPIVKVFRQGKVFEMDLDPNCESKKGWKPLPQAAKAAAVQGTAAIASGNAAEPRSAPASKPKAEAKKAIKKRKVSRTTKAKRPHASKTRKKQAGSRKPPAQ